LALTARIAASRARRRLEQRVERQQHKHVKGVRSVDLSPRRDRADSRPMSDWSGPIWWGPKVPAMPAPVRAIAYG
jgi:hypothetical protein